MSSTTFTILPTAARLHDGSTVIQVASAIRQPAFEPPATILWSQQLPDPQWHMVHLVHLPARVDTLTTRTASTRGLGVYRRSDAAMPIEPEIDEATWKGLPEPMQECYIQSREETVSYTEHPVGSLTFIEAEVVEAPKNWEPGVIGRVLGPGFWHAFPGHLTGWRDRAIEIAKEYARDVWTHHGEQHIEARVVSYYSPPRTHVERVPRSKKTVTREEFTSTSVKIATPKVVGGDTLADATAKWAAMESDTRASLERYAGSRKCSHCNGEGWVVCPAN